MLMSSACGRVYDHEQHKERRLARARSHPIRWKMDVCVDEPATAKLLGSNKQAHQRPTTIDPVSTPFHLGGDAAEYDWLGATSRAASQGRQSDAERLRAVPAEQI